MKKLITYTIFFLPILFIGIWFGPWDTYRIPQAGDGFGPTVGVVDLPVVVGEVFRWTSGAITQDEAYER